MKTVKTKIKPLKHIIILGRKSKKKVEARRHCIEKEEATGRNI